MQFPSWDQRQNKPKVQIAFNFYISCFIHVSEFCPFVSRPLPQLTRKKSTSGSLVGTNAAGNPIFFMCNSIYTVHIHFKGIIFIAAIAAILNIVIIQIICHDCHQKNEVDDQRWRRRRTSVVDSRTDRWLSICFYQASQTIIWQKSDPSLSGLVRPRGWSLTRTPIVR